MKPTYYALYNSFAKCWQVVMTVEYEEYLAVDVPDAGGQSNAERMARVLNA